MLDGKERHSSQFGVLHYRKVIEAAARHHICIDNHEPVIPTGLQRTYPNLVTQERVRGQEWDASEADYETNPTAIEIEEREVTSADTLSIWQARSGGTAIQLCPLEE